MRYLVHRYVVRRNFSSVHLAEGVSIVPVDDGITFFGYYNISPENYRGYVLYLKVLKEHVRGSLFEEASIMLKTKNGQVRNIGRTKSWNWQQGCMIQWLNSDKDHIIYNDYDPGTDTYVCKVIDTEGNLLKKYDMPINCVAQNGEYALCLNYDRLAIMRPDYGYFNRKNNALQDDDADGIWKLDLRSGKPSLVISLKHLKETSFTSTMKGATHKVNHIDINPSGSRFMFLHRWIGPAGRFMRLITAKPDGSDLQILNGDNMTSHTCWLDENQILSFCEYKGDVGYFVFSEQKARVRRCPAKIHQVDGHPSISPNGNKIIMDTYPGISRFSTLHLYCLEKKLFITLGAFHQPPGYAGEIRVDLHPKWSYHGDCVYVESAHENHRKLYKITLPES